MHTDRVATRMSSDQVAMRPIVDRQAPVIILPSLAIGIRKQPTITPRMHYFVQTYDLMHAIHEINKSSGDKLQSIALISLFHTILWHFQVT